jgi:hypothetical protein
LGTIFEQETGTRIFEEFERRFSKPLQMEDFKVSRCRYLNSNNYGDSLISEHRYYLFRVSARDLARFGLLFLREGRWQNDQIISSDWVKKSTATHSKIAPDSGYGYMWWTGTREGFLPGVNINDHSYHASGWGGHKVLVLPYRNLVIVHRVNTDWKGERVTSGQIGRLLWHILDAAGELKVQKGFYSLETIFTTRWPAVSLKQIGSWLNFIPITALSCGWGESDSTPASGGSKKTNAGYNPGCSPVAQKSLSTWFWMRIPSNGTAATVRWTAKEFMPISTERKLIKGKTRDVSNIPFQSILHN